MGSDGFYHIIGEVANTGEEHLEAVKVTAQFYDMDGSLIDEQVAPTLIDVVAPQQKSPFDIPEIEEFSNYTLSTSYEVSLLRPEFEFNFTGVQTSLDDQGNFVVEGQAVNNGTKQVEETHVVGTFYDSQGKVVGVGYSNTDPPLLDPGQGGAFRMVVEQAVQSVSHYALQAESNNYVEVPEFSPPSAMFVLIAAMVLVLCLATRPITSQQHNNDSGKTNWRR